MNTECIFKENYCHYWSAHRNSVVKCSGSEQIVLTQRAWHRRQVDSRVKDTTRRTNSQSTYSLDNFFPLPHLVLCRKSLKTQLQNTTLSRCWAQTPRVSLLSVGKTITTKCWNPALVRQRVTLGIKEKSTSPLKLEEGLYSSWKKPKEQDQMFTE